MLQPSLRRRGTGTGGYPQGAPAGGGKTGRAVRLALEEADRTDDEETAGGWRSARRRSKPRLAERDGPLRPPPAAAALPTQVLLFELQHPSCTLGRVVLLLH